MYTPWLDLSDEVSSASNRNCMKKLHPREVDVSTAPIEFHKPFCVSSSEVRVWDF
jgi:hypothetical protein